MMPRQMMVAPGGGVGALGGPVGGGGVPLGGPPVNGGVAQTQPAVLVQGQVHHPYHAKCNYISFPSKEPLTASMLAAAPQQDQKQMLGERMFPLVQAGIPLSLFCKIFPFSTFIFGKKYPFFQAIYPDLAGKVTGMLLDIDNAEILHMLVDHNSLREQV